MVGWHFRRGRFSPGREWWSSPQSGLMPESTTWEIDSGLTVVMMRKRELTNISPPQEPSDIGQIFRSVSPSHHSPIGPSWKKIFHTQPGFGFKKRKNFSSSSSSSPPPPAPPPPLLFPLLVLNYPSINPDLLMG